MTTQAFQSMFYRPGLGAAHHGYGHADPRRRTAFVRNTADEAARPHLSGMPANEG